MTGPAPRLSLAEYMTVARFDKAPPAPESFDATAAVRRVLALADEFDSYFGIYSDMRGRVGHEIRRAVEGQP